MKYEKILTMKEYIKQYIEKKRKLNKTDLFMLKQINCHKYHNLKAEYMGIAFDKDLNLPIFEPLSQTLYDEVKDD
jgi:hypothetical protein